MIIYIIINNKLKGELLMKTGNEYQQEIRKLIGEIFAMARFMAKGRINPTNEALKEICNELHELAIEYGINYKKYSKDGLNYLKNMTYNTGDDLTKYAVDIELIVFYKVKPEKSTYDIFKKEFSFIKPGKVNGKTWEYPQ